MSDKPTGLSKAFGTPASRDKRTVVGRRRYVRAMGTGFVLRPACGCPLPQPAFSPTVCNVCGGAELTIFETEQNTFSPVH